MTKNKALCILGVSASALLAAGWWLYSRRSKERIPSNEGLDDPAVAKAFGHIAEMPQMRLLHRFVVQRAMRMIQHGDAIDLGCGPGHLAILLAQRAPELHVTGVDLADEMLSQGEKLAARAGVGDRVSFKKGDARQIPFPDGSVDLVVSTLSLHHWRDPVAALNEVARVLRPGSSFLIFDLRRDLAMPVWLLLWFATRFVVPPALRRINEPMGSRDAAYTPSEAATLARQSRLSGWRITAGPLWLTIEGTIR
ncbi:MAG: methyltransferase domain-containing protein [Anaerolineae bacterium]|nr:methyltransferase domain-containing protein [Anaerolineae bacterium]